MRVIFDREPDPEEQPSLFAPGMAAWRAAHIWAVTSEPPLTVEKWQIDQRFMAGGAWYSIAWNDATADWDVKPDACSASAPPSRRIGDMENVNRETIKRPLDECACDWCGKSLRVGDDVFVDLKRGTAFCSSACAEQEELDRDPDEPVCPLCGKPMDAPARACGSCAGYDGPGEGGCDDE
jgi:hypothetical protein